MLQDDEWPEDVIVLMDNLAASLRGSGAASVTSTAIGADQRPISMYSVAVVGEVIVGVVLDCGAEALGVRWAMYVEDGPTPPRPR
jgi:hypothetical protein